MSINFFLRKYLGVLTQNVVTLRVSVLFARHPLIEIEPCFVGDFSVRQPF